jgi:two-component system, NarL family, nitrate/nitrite response regulator NarL
MEISVSKGKPTRDVNLYLLGENRLLRDTLARLLRKRPAIKVVGVSRNSETVCDTILASNCEIVLTDCFDTDSRLELLSRLVGRVPGIRLLLFGMDNDADLFLRAVCLGISGYLLKDASLSQIVAAVHAAARGEAACPPNLCMALFQHVSKLRAETPSNANLLVCSQKSLTGRQRQLLELIAKGLTNKEIATNLHLSEFTVKNHVRRIMRQADAQNRHEAVALLLANSGATVTGVV